MKQRMSKFECPQCKRTSDVVALNEHCPSNEEAIKRFRETYVYKVLFDYGSSFSRDAEAFLLQELEAARREERERIGRKITQRQNLFNFIPEHRNTGKKLVKTSDLDILSLLSSLQDQSQTKERNQQTNDQI